MPRARTQSGRASCADTVSELATESQAAPATTIAGSAVGSVLAALTASIAVAWTSVP
jgi:hypothetical protein